MKPSASLQRVERAARKETQAREQLHAAIREANIDHPLRTVAQFAGMSHEQVRKIVSRA